MTASAFRLVADELVIKPRKVKSKMRWKFPTIPPPNPVPVCAELDKTWIKWQKRIGLWKP